MNRNPIEQIRLRCGTGFSPRFVSMKGFNVRLDVAESSIGISAQLLFASRYSCGFKFGLRAFLREFFGLPSFAFVDRHRPGLLRDA